MTSSTLAGDAHHRARRWDVLVLGGALPGLVAAIRLGMARLRVLVVEEDAAARAPALSREPFFLSGGGSEDVLGACLQALGIPMIDRRGFENDPIAYQVLLPEARVEVGGIAATAEELSAWGLAKPEKAREVVRGLEAAAQAECEAMREAPIVRRGALRSLPRAPGAGRTTRHLRGLPDSVAHPSAELTPFFEAQVRVLSGMGEGNPSPEARARLLGSPLQGASSFNKAGTGLRALLRHRITSLHGEFRSIDCPFELIELGDHPGIARIGPNDFWLGRTLLVNAPISLVAGALEGWNRDPSPYLQMQGSAPRHRRISVHLRAQRDVVPEALARRAILVSDPAAPLIGANAIALTVHPSERGGLFAEVVASAVVEDDPKILAESDARIEEAVRRLMPFSQGRISRIPNPARPLWDDEAAAPTPERGDGWPGEVEIHTPGRRPVFCLPREGLAGLGLEGDLLLGWRAGDAIRAELS
jgi:hypothetical protein